MISRIMSVYPGHKYAIENLDGEGEQVIQFVQKGPLHPDVPGITIQDLLRICIDRLQVLDHEKSWAPNQESLHDLRKILARQEARAFIRHVEKKKIVHIELMEVDERDGHLRFEQL